MKNRTSVTQALLAMSLLSLVGSAALAAPPAPAPLTPEYAAKKENYRKQKDQQHISQDRRQAAADNLKAERIRVYNAKQAVKGAPPYDPAAPRKEIKPTKTIKK